MNNIHDIATPDPAFEKIRHDIADVILYEINSAQIARRLVKTGIWNIEDVLHVARNCLPVEYREYKIQRIRQKLTGESHV